jgi:DHA2 family multidrug resistance protein
MESERRKTLENPIDYMGLGLIAVGIGCLQYVLDKGQEEDWFSSGKIIVFLTISIVTLTWFVINEWNHSNPIVDLQLLKLKNFRMAAFMMFVLGMVMFGTTVLIPQFLQVLMGYSAENSGKALSAGAIVLVFMMPIIGQLVSRVDPRIMIATGFAASAAALYHMTNISLEIDFHTAMMYRVYQMMGVAFIFIPISTLAYVGIPRHKSNQVAGMNNLMRNLGGSIGISMLSTFLLRLAQRHQVYLVAHTSAGDPQFTQRIEGLTHRLTSQGIPPNEATAQAYTMMSRTIGAQATTLAYIDIIALMAVAVFCLAPLAFLMQRPPKNAKAAAAH